MKLSADSLVSEAVVQNFECAAMLDRLGISFFEYENMSLASLSQHFGVSLQFLNSYLATCQIKPSKLAFWMPNASISAILAHLNEWHKYFVHHKLPYMQRLTTAALAQPQNALWGCSAEVLHDLSIALPLFNADFIEHINEEEEEFFSFLRLLDAAQHYQWAFVKAIWQIFVKKLTVKQFDAHHHEEDDCMKGIRTLTHNYHLPPEASLTLRVLFSELQDFEQELSAHADIENHILTPQALKLEQNILARCNRLSFLH
ncbi:MAG: hypothetical protein EAZ57_11765 [Cytophagales bacterium]|nr:MAG: hypothetical protein EAZ67_12815 [Cytophagales bacterium]TAF59268.1 MAG: hypothetical protein EAZ57_11765 [Cytophagales bacterium]